MASLARAMLALLALYAAAIAAAPSTTTALDTTPNGGGGGNSSEGELSPSPPPTPAPASPEAGAVSTPPVPPPSVSRRKPPRNNNRTRVHGDKATAHGRKRIVCRERLFSARVGDAVSFGCAVFPRAGETFEVRFYRRGRFRSPDADPEYFDEPPRPELPRERLLFSSANASLAHADALAPVVVEGERATVANVSGEVSVRVAAADAETEGVYTWRVLSANGTEVRSANVSLLLYSQPEFGLSAPPVLFGEPFRAVCVVRDYYPRRSVRLRWFADEHPVDAAFVTNSTVADELGRRTRVSVVNVTRADVPGLAAADAADALAPSLRCEAVWYRDSVASQRFSEALRPHVYHPAAVSVRFVEGFAVCDGLCVPPEARLAWSDHAADTVYHLGACAEHPGLLNVRSARPLSDLDGPVDYTCRLEGLPSQLPVFEDTQRYDASPASVSWPVVSSMIVVIAGIGILAIVLVIMATCVYYRRAGP
ncbi:envelope glycoprotein C [Suid alphaherpesvirus 1]|uniref:Membrane glycoprotein gC n=1 Tax=Suid herpesvirus 1 TaxID=10345 RepID=Q5PPB2_SUHV|nr:envelope glycoprotein C [Suid alphaherpesvirus 1]DAA02167.1 TPA_exp: membrane glycoprotein gC precursor [Suid alphaherpesvirus 1]